MILRFRANIWGGNWEKAQLPLPITHDEEFYAFLLEYTIEIET